MTARSTRPRRGVARRAPRPIRERRPSCFVHPTAIVAPSAELDADVSVGPYAVIGPHVCVGRGTTVGPHAMIEGHTTIGAENRIFQFAAIGAITPDLKYRGEDSQLIVGDRNTIREFTTLHPGTAVGGMITRVGNDNLLMPYTHVAHDCTVGDHNIMANGAQLGGHVSIENYVVVSALVGIHQFTKIGESVILGAGAMVAQDVAPFCNATGDRAVLYGLNVIGLRRRGFSEETIATLKRAYRIMFRSGHRVAAALARIRTDLPALPELERFVRFIERSERGVCRPAARGGPGDDSA
jgi:UDP-N-acetylglucosamine acyltransferase